MQRKINILAILISLLTMFLVPQFSQAQLPNYATPDEWKNIPVIHPASAKGITTPPTSKLRTMAEWEEIDALLITWASQFQILSQILKYAQDECRVVVLCSDSNNVKNYLSGLSITPYNVTFIEAPFNSIWCRDYGQWSAYMNDVDSLVLVDWIYNRPRPLDDQVPDVIGNHFNLQVYNMTQAPNDLVHTGGNFMVDGLGTGFSSKLVLDENDNGSFNITDKTEAEIDTLMKLYMGIDRFIKMDVLPYDLIHHIDMHMKLLDEETLLVGEYPAGIADGPQIEANLQYVTSNFNSAFGTPYRVIRVQMPPENGKYPHNGGDYRTYANAVIINKTILVPTYEQQYDDPALQIWKDAMPGYRIKGINCNSIIGLSGALHCITKAVGTSDPLMIVHQPIRGEQASGQSFTIDATVKHRSGIANAQLYYTNDTNSAYNPVNMILSDPANDIWSANIPAQGNDEEVYYYISASSNSGKQRNKPMPAPDGFWYFKTGTVTAFSDPLVEQFELGQIYPNPASAITVIPIRVSKSGLMLVELYDMPGKSVNMIFSGYVENGERNIFLDASNLSSGTYLVRVTGASGSAFQQLFVR